MLKEQKVAIYIDPPSHHFLDNKLFIVEDGRLNGDRINAPYAHLREFFNSKGIQVHTADFLPKKANGMQCIYFSMGMLDRYKQLSKRSDVVLSAYFAMECPNVEPRIYRALPEAGQFFKRLMSWSDGESLAPFVGKVLPFQQFYWPQSFDCVHEEEWNRRDRKFLVMINGNKLPRLYWQELTTERMRALEYFSRTGEIELYGKGWDEPSLRVGITRVPWTLRRLHHQFLKYWQILRPDPLLVAARKVYCGTARSKSQTLSQYTFAICYENMILKGWITEKIFDCFFSGTIPVYWGAPEITDYIPEDCFIDKRRFATYEDLRDFLKSLNENDIRGYRERAREYISSTRFDSFRKKTFTETFKSIFEQDSGIKL